MYRVWSRHLNPEAKFYYLSFRPPTNTFEGRLWPESVCDILFVIPAQAGIQGKIKMVKKKPAVYILASKKNGTLYIGVTSDLVKRIWEHKNNLVEGFTKRYDVHHLVWYELHEEMASAIERERNLKEWKRSWKLRLIESSNPDWQDLYDTIL